MNGGSTTSMRLAVIDRRKNGVVSSEPVEDSQNPLTPPDTVIWRHTRFDLLPEVITEQGTLTHAAGQTIGKPRNESTHQLLFQLPAG